MALWPWEEQYVAIMAERKEMAFHQWMASGYRDIDAHDRFVHLYEHLTQKKWRVK